MIKIKDVISAVEDFAPTALQLEYDNCGLKNGCTEMAVTGILVTLDTTCAVVDEAIKKGCNMIVEHHPLIFRPISALNYNLPSIKALVKAVKSDIAIYSAHTNVDFTLGGLNDSIAEKIGLTDIKAINGLDSARIGNLMAPLTLKEYAEKIAEILKDNGVRTVGNENKIIQRAAVINGGGGNEESVLATFDAGADIFVTADVKYSAARLAKDLDYGIITFGHYESEIDFTDLIATLLKSKFPFVNIQISEDCDNPFN